MSYSFEKKFDKWDTEPDTLDIFLIEEIELEKSQPDTLSLNEIEIEEVDLDEVYL